MPKNLRKHLEWLLYNHKDLREALTRLDLRITPSGVLYSGGRAGRGFVPPRPSPFGAACQPGPGKDLGDPPKSGLVVAKGGK
jgi:hypothetical protein